MPMEPVSMLAQSERMSPKMLPFRTGTAHSKGLRVDFDSSAGHRASLSLTSSAESG